ncbi:sugar phosphate isomerase/epimerase, partial [bacterium]|nr:sugar phosphate isomerase/epimerase [bacterium]
MIKRLAKMVLAVGFAAVAVVPAKGEQQTKLKIGYRTQAYSRMEFREALSDIKNRGYGGVEFCLDSPPVRRREFDEAAAKKFARMISDAGLEVYSVSHHGNFVSNDRFFAELKRLIPLARAMDTRLFVISSGPIDRKNRRGQFVAVEKRLRELTEVAEKAGVTLALEAEPNLAVESTRELMQLIWKIESPALRINLDIGHAYLSDDDLVEAIRKAAKLIVHAHIDDMSGGLHKHLIPGTGEIDLPAVMTAFLE